MTEHRRRSMTEQGDNDRTGQGVAITAAVRNKVFTAQELEMVFSNHSP